VTNSSGAMTDTPCAGCRRANLMSFDKAASTRWWRGLSHPP
jgi:hypothetical protein